MGILELLGKLNRRDKQVRIVLLGLDNAGKSSILKALSDDKDISTVAPTMGFMIKNLVYNNCQLHILDVAGQRANRPYWRIFLHQAKGLIYVIDSADRRFLEETAIELQQILDEEALNRIPILIFANKQDIIGAATPDEISSALNLYNIRDRPWHIQACSAKTGEGLEAGFRFLVEKLDR